ncbi:TSUP family transporter [Campylobacter pinnipediorum]|uniref:TSUP family transporter n=1 Tax=Campylobacter pinnipediorum TaxID=1965231 RepID=UPI00084DBC66|nr:TSUP family transporter [Campylobacter pinnipediorum]
MEFDFLVYCVFFVGAFVGGFIDAIAGGGGLIIVPLLMAFGIDPHTALATNKLQGSFGSFTASLNFTLKGMINFKEVFICIFFTFVGACIGAKTILFLNTDILKIIVPFLLISIFVYTIFSPNITEQDRKSKIDPKVFYICFGLLLGFYDGFFGPGTGSFWTFSMVALLGLNIKKAVANTKIFNFTSNIVSLFIFILSGNILWFVGALMGVAAIIGAYFGSNLVIKKEIKFIRFVFLSVVAFTILKLLWDFFK